MARRYAASSLAAAAGASATAAAALVGATAAFSGVGTASPPSSGGVAACTEKTSTLAETVAGRASAAASVVAAGTKSSSDAVGKPGSTYADRFLRVIGLMDPRHTLTTEADVRSYQRLLKEHRVGEKNGALDKELAAAAAKVDASCNVATGEVIPAPFRLSGFLVCNIPIVAAMLFNKSVYVQVMSHWVNQSLNTAVNYYNRSGAEMTKETLAMSYALAIGTACPLAYGLGKAFQRAPPSLRRFSFIGSYIAVAAAGSMNVLFTRASEITGGVQVTDESGEARGVSKKAGLQCVLQTVVSRGLILPIPVVVLPAAIVGLMNNRGLMPSSPRGKMWAQVGVLTGSLAFALPMSIAVFPQEARFKASTLEPQLQHLLLKGGSRGEVNYLYANKGL
ncbi:unnamed protein product [Ectocarpus sp. 8 AP-2014]